MKSQLPWLSICLPVYNVEKYLEDCLLSILKQDLDGVEIILWNDASTDKSLEIAKQFAVNNPFIKLFNAQKNVGLSAVRNNMLNEAEGDYIWFVDSDDLVLDDAILILRNAISKNNPDFLMFDFKVIREHFGIKHYIRGENHRSTFFGRSNFLIEDKSYLLNGMFLASQMHIWSKVIHRSLWKDGIFFPENKSFEDMDVVPRLALKASKALHLRKTLIGYRQRDGSILNTLSPEKSYDLSSALNSFKHDLKKISENEFHQIKVKAGFAISYLSFKNCVGSIKIANIVNDDSINYFLKNFKFQTFIFSREIFFECIRRFWFLRDFKVFLFFKKYEK